MFCRSRLPIYSLNWVDTDVYELYEASEREESAKKNAFSPGKQPVQSARPHVPKTLKTRFNARAFAALRDRNVTPDVLARAWVGNLRRLLNSAPKTDVDLWASNTVRRAASSAPIETLLNHGQEIIVISGFSDGLHDNKDLLRQHFEFPDCRMLPFVVHETTQGIRTTPAAGIKLVAATGTSTTHSDCSSVSASDSDCDNAD